MLKRIKNLVKLVALLPLTLLLVFPPLAANAAESTLLQGLVGASSFEADGLTFRVPSDEASQDEDLSSMPTLGLVGQYFFNGGSTRLGVEGSLLFSWRSRDTSVVAGSNQAVVKIDTSLWLLDLSAGVGIEQRLGSRWRFYLLAGPAMVFGEYHEDNDVVDAGEADGSATTDGFGERSESEFGIGGYARAGIEYEFAPRSLIGISIRGLATDMEFDGTADPSGVRGVQGFLTFTRDFGGYDYEVRRFRGYRLE